MLTNDPYAKTYNPNKRKRTSRSNLNTPHQDQPVDVKDSKKKISRNKNDKKKLAAVVSTDNKQVKKSVDKVIGELKDNNKKGEHLEDKICARIKKAEMGLFKLKTQVQELRNDVSSLNHTLQLWMTQMRNQLMNNQQQGPHQSLALQESSTAASPQFSSPFLHLAPPPLQTPNQSNINNLQLNRNFPYQYPSPPQPQLPLQTGQYNPHQNNYQ